MYVFDGGTGRGEKGKAAGMISYLGKSLILLGIMLIIVGILFMLGAKIQWLGRLPGDIVIHKKHFTFYFPIATSILISIILTLIFFLLFRHK